MRTPDRPRRQSIGVLGSFEEFERGRVYRLHLPHSMQGLASLPGLRAAPAAPYLVEADRELLTAASEGGVLIEAIRRYERRRFRLSSPRATLLP